jgi:hypothetical protein
MRESQPVVQIGTHLQFWAFGRMHFNGGFGHSE